MRYIFLKFNNLLFEVGDATFFASPYGTVAGGEAFPYQTSLHFELFIMRKKSREKCSALIKQM